MKLKPKRQTRLFKEFMNTLRIKQSGKQLSFRRPIMGIKVMTEKELGIK